MDPALITLAFATLAFAGGHFLLSSAPVRGPLTGMMGERPFRGVYSVLMIAALYWMITAYMDAPYVPLWNAGILGPPVILILMYFATVFFVCSVTTRNPTMVGMDNLHYENAPGKGIYAIVRHPMMAAIALWSLAHLFVRGIWPPCCFSAACWRSRLWAWCISTCGATPTRTMPGDRSGQARPARRFAPFSKAAARW